MGLDSAQRPRRNLPVHSLLPAPRLSAAFGVDAKSGETPGYPTFIDRFVPTDFGPGPLGHLRQCKQEARIAQQQKQIETLTAALQKVSAQLELSKSAPQTVLNIQ
jgi:hypothetical protein